MSRFRNFFQPITPFVLAKCLAAFVVLQAVIWWSVWTLGPARLAAPMSAFPSGEIGGAILSVAACMILALIFILFPRQTRTIVPGPTIRLNEADAAFLSFGLFLIFCFWSP